MGSSSPWTAWLAFCGRVVFVHLRSKAQSGRRDEMKLACNIHMSFLCLWHRESSGVTVCTDECVGKERQRAGGGLWESAFCWLCAVTGIKPFGFLFSKYLPGACFTCPGGRDTVVPATRREHAVSRGQKYQSHSCTNINRDGGGFYAREAPLLWERRTGECNPARDSRTWDSGIGLGF